MAKESSATRSDIDDVLDVMMTRIDDRFTQNESASRTLQQSIHHIQNQLDGIEKQLEISDDERMIMAHQLTQLHDWVERAAKRIDVTFAH